MCLLGGLHLLQGAVITECYATSYYSVHETGHRLGFFHANMYQLLGDATAAPADPAGPGHVTPQGYTDALDVMACCRSDYGLYYRFGVAPDWGGDDALYWCLRSTYDLKSSTKRALVPPGPAG